MIRLTQILRLRNAKSDPFKTCISQPLWDAYFIGPECCEMQVLNGPILKKNNPMVTMSFMHNAHLKRREYMVTFNREKNKFIDHSARMYLNVFYQPIQLNHFAVRND